jgi:cytochrome c oxidase subunit 4
MSAHANPHAANAPHGHAGDDHSHHVVPLKVLLTVFAILMVLTVLTVAATWVNLGPVANVSIALGIAVIKSALVAAYFMHLRWDSPFNTIVFICALLFVALFIGFAVLDTRQYSVNFSPPAANDPR